MSTPLKTSKSIKVKFTKKFRTNEEGLKINKAKTTKSTFDRVKEWSYQFCYKKLWFSIFGKLFINRTSKVKAKFLT